MIGNGINLNSGVVTTEGGNIFLTSVESGSVGLSQEENGLTLIDEGITKYQDINLSQQSLINSSGEKVGNIFIKGQNVNLLDGSFVLSQNQGSSPGGSINLKALESLTLSGSSPDGDTSSSIRSEVLKTAGGTSSSIDISANRLAIQDFGRIQTDTFSDNPNAVSGDINITTSEVIDVNFGSIASATFGKGKAGNINLSTAQFRLNGIGVLTSSTVGTGDGGTININADLLEIAGAGFTPDGIYQVSSISASSFREGNAGDINIAVEKLRLLDGASLSATGAGNGNAGNLNINASESIEVNGKNEVRETRNFAQSTIRASIVAGRNPRLGLPKPTGDAGNLTAPFGLKSKGKSQKSKVIYSARNWSQARRRRNSVSAPSLEGRN